MSWQNFFHRIDIWQYWISFFQRNPTCTTMQNEAGEYVDMYIPRCVDGILCRVSAVLWDFFLAGDVLLLCANHGWFLGSAAPPTGSCLPGTMLQSRCIVAFSFSYRCFLSSPSNFNDVSSVPRSISPPLTSPPAAWPEASPPTPSAAPSAGSSITRSLLQWIASESSET